MNTPIKYGHHTVTLLEQTVEAVQKLDTEEPVNEDDVVIIRKLKIVNEKEKASRFATHFQYTGWMDFGVPDNPLGTLKIIRMADEAQSFYSNIEKENNQEPVGPMIVHCSAGCGRSGAFCAIDTVLYRISEMKRENVNEVVKDILLETISRFREQRLSMVQTLRQFVFCYEAIWWWYLGYGVDNSNNQLSSVNDMDTSL